MIGRVPCGEICQVGKELRQHDRWRWRPPCTVAGCVALTRKSHIYHVGDATATDVLIEILRVKSCGGAAMFDLERPVGQPGGRVFRARERGSKYRYNFLYCLCLGCSLNSLGCGRASRKCKAEHCQRE